MSQNEEEWNYVRYNRIRWYCNLIIDTHSLFLYTFEKCDFINNKKIIWFKIMCNVLPCKTKKAWVPKVNMFYLKLEGMKRKIQIVFFCVCQKSLIFNYYSQARSISIVFVCRYTPTICRIWCGHRWFCVVWCPIRSCEASDAGHKSTHEFSFFPLGDLVYRLNHWIGDCSMTTAIILNYGKTFVVFMCVSKINLLR